MTCGKQRASARTARLACDRILKFFSSNFQNSCYHGRKLFDKAAPQKAAPSTRSSTAALDVIVAYKGGDLRTAAFGDDGYKCRLR